MPTPLPPAIRRTPVAGAALLLLAACGRDPAPPAESTATVPVALGAVRRDTVAQAVLATGTYASRDELPLAFKVGGVVARIDVDEGDRVRRGQRLAALDLREIDALRARARIAAEKATRDAERVRRLYADSVVTRAQWQDAESARAAAEAELAAAEVNREYAVITAPGDGRVLRRSAEAGALVGPGQEVLRVGDDRRGRVVRVGLTGRDAVRAAVGQPADVTFEALPGRRFTGRVVLVGAATDPRTGTVPVEVAVSGAEALPSGAVATVRLHVPARETVSLVPVESLVEADGDSATVYTVTDGRARRHRVRVRFLAGAAVAIDALDADSVVTSGAGFVRDAGPVRRVEGVR
jgi:multidrug efflux system membrane fusion protein